MHFCLQSTPEQSLPTSEVPGPPLQVKLLYDGKERGRMYAAYALSSIMTPSQPLAEMRAAGVIPALITVLNTSKVSPAPHHSLWCSPASMCRGLDLSLQHTGGVYHYTLLVNTKLQAFWVVAPYITSIPGLALLDNLVKIVGPSNP